VDDRPDPKYINRHIRDTVCSEHGKWYDLGMELLDREVAVQLSAIKTKEGSDTREKFREMINLWLESKSDATWNQLIAALRQSHIALNHLATTAENLLHPPVANGSFMDSSHSVGEKKHKDLHCDLTMQSQVVEQNADNQCEQTVTVTSCASIQSLAIQSSSTNQNHQESSLAVEQLKGRQLCKGRLYGYVGRD